MLFAKPEWFKTRKFGWGLTPKTKEGWIYTILMILAYIIPIIYGSKKNNQIYLGLGYGIMTFFIIDMIWITIYLYKNKNK